MAFSGVIGFCRFNGFAHIVALLVGGDYSCKFTLCSAFNFRARYF